MNTLIGVFGDTVIFLDDVVSLSRYFVEANTNVVDIGCSTGKLTARILEHNHEACPDAQYVGVEVAEGFFDNLADRKVERWMRCIPIHL